MIILITAPNLDEKENISGISAVVNTIIRNSPHQFVHYKLGRSDKDNSIARLIRLASSLVRFPFFLIGKKIDLMHLNWALEYPSIYRDSVIFLWAKLFGLKVIVHLHGGKFLMQKPDKITDFIIRSVLKNAGEVIVLSSTEAGTIKELYNVANCNVLANSVQVDSPPERHENKIPVVLFLGRICESKGVQDIVEALKIIKDSCSFEFVLCGTGPMAGYLTGESARVLGNKFIYKGIVKGEEKKKIIHSADVFLLPSRYGEGLPVALLETMAAGVVPIVTNDASMKEIIRDKQNGIIVKKQNPEDLAEKIKMILENKTLASAISYGARETIINNYNIQIFVKKLNDIYEAASASKPVHVSKRTHAGSPVDK